MNKQATGPDKIMWAAGLNSSVHFWSRQELTGDNYFKDNLLPRATFHRSTPEDAANLYG